MSRPAQGDLLSFLVVNGESYLNAETAPDGWAVRIAFAVLERAIKDAICFGNETYCRQSYRRNALAWLGIEGKLRGEPPLSFDVVATGAGFEPEVLRAQIKKMYLLQKKLVLCRE